MRIVIDFLYQESKNGGIEKEIMRRRGRFEGISGGIGGKKVKWVPHNEGNKLLTTVYGKATRTRGACQRHMLEEEVQVVLRWLT